MHHPTYRITHTTAFVVPVVEHWLEWEIVKCGIWKVNICYLLDSSSKRSKICALNPWGGGKLFTCPYPLKVQARPPWAQRPAFRSRVSGQEDSILFFLHLNKTVCCYVMEGNVLFNDALNTFYLCFYGVRLMVKDHSDSERGNPLPPHRLLFPNTSKGSFICIIPQTW